ncbi:MAG: SUMF1/EgtB/PvdO family nonheme iron enzyme [Deltaproteobacteria bacterium]|nr:SUMF1/EgtB/PvdO family nonheme iron enzyme [Deltaproteobacteria bacterium]
MDRIIYSDGEFVVEERDIYPMEDHPVHRVSWYGAVVYCNWLSEANGLTPCYDTITWECDFTKNGYRLPTEAEWERAAAWDGSKHWIYSIVTDTLTGSDRVNWGGMYTNTGNPLGLSASPYTSPVGWFDGVNVGYREVETVDSPSPVGCYDMSGNVFEWCHDRYDNRYYEFSPESNPTGPLIGADRVIRGGGCQVRQMFQRSAYRRGWNPGTTRSGQSYTLGFRLARNN